MRRTRTTVAKEERLQAEVSIRNPNGTSLLTPSYVGTSGAFMDTKTLPETGDYMILVDPQGTASGSMTLTLYDVPPGTTGQLTPGGPPLGVPMDTPGQNGRLSFERSAGQRVALELTGVTIGTSSCCSTKVSILKPDGTTLASPTTVGTSGRLHRHEDAARDRHVHRPRRSSEQRDRRDDAHSS